METKLLPDVQLHSSLGIAVIQNGYILVNKLYGKRTGKKGLIEIG